MPDPTLLELCKGDPLCTNEAECRCIQCDKPLCDVHAGCGLTPYCATCAPVDGKPIEEEP